MNRDRIIAQLRQNRAELEAAGAEHVSVFGSVAREENNADSDLDVLVKFADPVILSGFGYFSAVETLKKRIAAITGAAKVDIVSEPVEKERLRRNVERDRAIAY